jgi:hypothetical protein
VAVDGFEIRIDGNFVHLELEEVYGFPDHTDYFGGDDAQGYVSIQCGSYRAYGHLQFSTGEIWQFYTELLRAYKDLDGKARFSSGGGNLEFTITFNNKRGHVTIEGLYQEQLTDRTRLVFEIEGDQSYLAEPLAQLAQFVAKYGDNRGIRR